MSFVGKLARLVGYDCAFMIDCFTNGAIAETVWTFAGTCLVFKMDFMGLVGALTWIIGLNYWLTWR